MKHLSPILAVCLLAGGMPELAEAASTRFEVEVVASPEASDWVADACDNICGLRKLNQLSNPAKVDFPDLMALTPEMKKIEEEGIDPNSPEGIQLREAAVDRVTKACDKVRKEKGHCSVWKKIRHKDGRTVPDVTKEVETNL